MINIFNPYELLLHIKNVNVFINKSKSIIYLLSLIACIASQAQTEYWQQELHYAIDVSLDDESHELDAFMKLDYINHSPEKLTEIVFHLWPNAYKSLDSEFAKQKVENGDLTFYNSLKSQRGGIDQLAFTADGDTLSFTAWKDREDIVVVQLKYPLEPGDRVLIETPFRVKIPESFSRLGRVGQSYQITQWYPKPAVFDANGWHPMSYLDMGEFYSEFGSFDVKITLPENYVVGGTGNLQTQSELDFLRKRAEETAAIDQFEKSLEFPASAEKYKVLHYQQDNVHDFAWFADKRFHVLAEDFTLATNGENCTAWVMFTNQEAHLWKDALEYVIDGTQFYAAKVGDYPYQNVTALQSALSAGAGMEYPTITVIGQAGSPHLLERVIVHEVGHNWFYGMLASNEREHPWMDEGMNSYYEMRYFKEKYGSSSELAKAILPDFATKLIGMEGVTDYELEQIVVQALARTRSDQAICSHSEHFTEANYGAIAYAKAALAFEYLESDLGQRKFDLMMQDYFNKWSFKHPQPEDFCSLLEERAAKEISWFCDGIINTTKRVDYKLHKLKQNADEIGEDSFDALLVRNHPRNLASPFSISAIKDGEITETVKYDGFKGQTEVLFPSSEYDYLQIDANNRAPEYDRRNDVIRPRPFLKHWKGFQVSLLPKVERDATRHLFITPMLAWNYYDRAMLGATIYNNVFPSRNFDFILAPMYATGSAGLTGFAEVRYKYYPANGPISKIQVQLAGRKFGYANYRLNDDEDADIQYKRLVPSLRLQLRKPSMRSPVNASITLRHVHLWSEQPNIEENRKPNNYFEEDYVNELAFNWAKDRTLNPFGFELVAQHSTDFLYASLEANYQLSFGSEGKVLDFRFFGGSFFNNETEGRKLARQGLTDWGEYDFLHDDIYLGRNQTGFFKNQIYGGKGGFKLPSSIGRTQDWLFAFNFTSDLPFVGGRFPLRFFFDLGTTDGELAYDSNLMMFVDEKVGWEYDMGLALSLIGGRVEVFFPLLLSADLKNNYEVNNRNFFDRISFKIDFARLEPIGMIRRLPF